LAIKCWNMGRSAKKKKGRKKKTKRQLRDEAVPLYRRMSPDGLEAYFTIPRPQGYKVSAKTRIKNKNGPFEKVRPDLRDRCQARFEELIRRKKERGLELTQHRIASAYANAAYYGTQRLTGRDNYRMLLWKKRKKRWDAILAQRAEEAKQKELEAFKAQPLEKRMKAGMM
jgi:hypothetical protein